MRIPPTPSGWFGRVREFFLAEEVPYGLALTRIVLPIVLFLDLVKRWPYVREWYSTDGATAPIWISYGYPNALPELPGAVAVGLFTLLLASLITTSLGWMTRISLLLATTLYFYFTAIDALGTLTKYTVIANHVLLLLTLSGCGSVWSVDALRQPIRRVRHGVWPRRLMQLLLGIVYIGAAMTKVHTPSYFSGDQMMFWMITHVNGSHPVGEAMSYYPSLLVVGAYATWLWEILFIFVAWRGAGRLIMLGLGLGFHTMTALTLGLFYFPPVMLAMYFAYLNTADVGKISTWLRTRFGHPFAGFAGLGRRFDCLVAPAYRTGAIGFGCAIWCVVLAGIAGERLYDPYRERGPDGPQPLQSIPAELAKQMIGPSDPLRPQDKVFAFELGTDLFASTLIGRKSEFRRGEKLIACAILTPPHEDVYVESQLCLADGRLIERNGRVITRETMRPTFEYRLGETLPLGEYQIVLTQGTHQIGRRTFTLVDSPQSDPTPAPQQVVSR